jgi:hypothetical protein
VKPIWTGAVSLALFVALAALASCSRSDRITGPAESRTPSGQVAQRSSGEAVTARASELAMAPARAQGLDRALAAQDEVSRSLIGVHGDVVGTAVSIYQGEPVVLALTRRATSGVPATIAGVRVVQYVVDDLHAQAYYCGTSTSRTDQCAAGTLGAIVTDGVRNYWLSNWHVFVESAGAVGDAVDSPGRVDAGCSTTPVVGAVSRFTAVRFDGSANTVDCAIAKITASSVSAIESAGSRSFLPSAQVVAPAVGQTLKKVGRTTGFTTGTVVGVNATVYVKYGTRVAKFVNCVITGSMSQPGDSGSLMCTASGNNPVALLFAGSSTTSVGCPIGAVFSAMGAHIAN